MRFLSLSDQNASPYARFERALRAGRPSALGMLMLAALCVLALNAAYNRVVGPPARAAAGESRLMADDVGIHFQANGRDYTDPLEWGEIANVSAHWLKQKEGADYLVLEIEHISDIIHDISIYDHGYANVTAAMEKHLIGFSRARAEAIGHGQEGEEYPVVWRRDLLVQPFRSRPGGGSPDLKKAVQNVTVYHCEELLGRALEPAERACIGATGKEGYVEGKIVSPLRETLLRRQAELRDQEAGK